MLQPIDQSARVIEPHLTEFLFPFCSGNHWVLKGASAKLFRVCCSPEKIKYTLFSDYFGFYVGPDKGSPKVMPTLKIYNMSLRYHYCYPFS